MRLFDRIRLAAMLSLAVAGMSDAARASEDHSAAFQRGAAVYRTYCTLCHGVDGKGNGRAAGLQKVKPADLTVSRRSDRYKRAIVRGGGVSMNRSASMPAWKTELTDRQIDAVIAYLRVLRGSGADQDTSHIASSAHDSAAHAQAKPR